MNTAPRPIARTAALLVALAAASSPQPAFPLDKWLYVSTNLQVADNADDLEALMERGKAAGYTRLLLADSKFAQLNDVIDQYFVNARRIRAAADRLGIEIIPAIFSIGYSNDLLSQNPQLVEAMPVRGLELIVRDGEVVAAPHDDVVLPGGDMSDLSKWSWKDENIIADQGAARIHADGGNARIVQRLTLKPFHQYHVSVRIKSEDFRGQPEIKALTADGHSLQWANLGVQPTQDWTEHHAVFNSLEHTDVSLYLGVWGAQSGALWWDDARIEQVPFLNLVRRPGCPLVIRTSEGQELQEGVDFEPLSDPLMGTQPWNGEYTVFHAPPRLKLKRKLTEGTRLTADFFHAITVYDGQVMICPSEPQTVDLLRDQVQRVHALWSARGYMMSHDEVRVLNHCAACRARGLSPGQILADNARTCVNLLRETAPQATIYVWSDMFDPHHNAVAGPYYLVNGSLQGAWEGLDRDVVIVNWNFGQRDKSLKFFAGRGHRQVIAGYYDAPVEQAADWLQSARGVEGVDGMMYTTWIRRFDDLEAFSRVVNQATAGR